MSILESMIQEASSIAILGHIHSGWRLPGIQSRPLELFKTGISPKFMRWFTWRKLPASSVI